MKQEADKRGELLVELSASTTQMQAACKAAQQEARKWQNRAEGRAAGAKERDEEAGRKAGQLARATEMLMRIWDLVRHAHRMLMLASSTRWPACAQT